MKQDEIPNVVDLGFFISKAKVLQLGNFPNLLE